MYLRVTDFPLPLLSLLFSWWLKRRGRYTLYHMKCSRTYGKCSDSQASPWAADKIRLVLVSFEIVVSVFTNHAWDSVYLEIFLKGAFDVHPLSLYGDVSRMVWREISKDSKVKPRNTPWIWVKGKVMEMWMCALTDLLIACQRSESTLWYVFLKHFQMSVLQSVSQESQEVRKTPTSLCTLTSGAWSTCSLWEEVEFCFLSVSVVWLVWPGWSGAFSTESEILGNIYELNIVQSRSKSIVIDSSVFKAAAGIQQSSSNEPNGSDWCTDLAVEAGSWERTRLTCLWLFTVDLRAQR